MTDGAGSVDSAYATQGWGIHDDRWFSALTAVGLTPERLSIGEDLPDADALHAAVAAAVAAGRPVLAGPVHTVTAGLAGLPGIVGLSWGHDLVDLDAAGADLAWLAALSGIVVDSSENRRIARRAGIPDERITTLPWGIDLSQFTADGARATAADLGLATCSEFVLSLRAHEAMYRVDDIVSAFAAMQGARPGLGLVIGHAGSLTPQLRSQVADLGLDDAVAFIGTVPESDLAPLLRGAACYVTASRVDGTSVTLLQAMACGTPVVASANAGNVDWVTDHETGLLYPVGDVPALAKALLTACERGPEVLTWAVAARARVEELADWPRNISRLRGAMDVAAQDLRPRLSP